MADNELATSAQRRAFVFDNHTCVVGYGRRTAGPSMSIVHYVMDGDRIVFLTMSARQKAKAVKRGVPLSVCVLAGHGLAGQERGLAWPPEYLIVDGTSELVTDMDYIVERAFGIGEIMRGEPVPAAARPAVREMMTREKRVAVRFTPESTFHSPSVHPESDGKGGTKEMVHGLGARLPW